MQKFQAVLLRVWQEACRHIEIEASTQNIAEMLVGGMPVGRVIVRRIDPQQGIIETVADAKVDKRGARPMQDAAPVASRRSCDRGAMDALLTWCDQGNVLQGHFPNAEAGTAGWVVPEGLLGDVLAGPLVGHAGSRGVLLLVARNGARFGPRDRTLAAALLDPFSTAMENDRRVRQLAALREAAEAERRSLLSRLGRKQLVDTIVGIESGLSGVMQRVELVARSEAPVLIFGETGTGKELVARTIHHRSPRADGPMHRVNCGAIAPELIDSELFGHEKGAFTGAVDMRKGWFERADGGTLFLDEIGELPPAAQVRLLRILQDGWLQRVGGGQSIHVDVRIVAATHRDLVQMVAEGRFREDLWYRIAVFPIVLPPLRERRQDIGPLAAHFARRAATRFSLPLALPSDEDVRLLCAYDWPGNVRELGTVIDRAAILGEGVRLEVAAALGTARPGVPANSTTSTPRPVAAEQSIQPLEAIVRQHIEAALRATGGKVEGRGGAAALLQINPNTLRARMRKLGIDWARFRGRGGETE